jgi:DNA-binding transcriptional ArsR family regulator
MAIPPIAEIELLHNRMCKAVGDTTRIRILYALNEKLQYVTELAELLSIPQPTVSRHLAILKQCSLVVAERDGAAVYYRLSDERIISVLDTMRQLLRESVNSLQDILS